MTVDLAQSNDHESHLIQRAADGDRAAIGELLLRSTDELTRFIARKLPKAMRATVSVEDVLQETYRVAFRDIQQFRPIDGKPLVVWLRTIAGHQLQDAMRFHGRVKRKPPNSAGTVLQLFDALAGDDSTPLRRASRNDALQCMHVALAELPEQYRDAIWMQYMEGKSYDEIAEAMGKTSQAVHGLIKRAKQRLRELLGSVSNYLSSR